MVTLSRHVTDLARNGHTAHAHHFHLACIKDVHSLCGDMLTQWGEVGCVGAVQFQWCTHTHNNY